MKWLALLALFAAQVQFSPKAEMPGNADVELQYICEQTCAPAVRLKRLEHGSVVLVRTFYWHQSQRFGKLLLSNVSVIEATDLPGVWMMGDEVPATREEIKSAHVTVLRKTSESDIEFQEGKHDHEHHRSGHD